LRQTRVVDVGSDTRKARAIASVVGSPGRRSVSAPRASVDSTGWQPMKISRSRSSPTGSAWCSASASTKSGT